MKLRFDFRCARPLFAPLVGALLLAGCWGWIPEDPAPPGPADAGAPAPAPASAPAAYAAAALPAGEGVAPGVAATTEIYAVVPGDTLFSIAWRFHLKLSDLAAWNQLGDGSLIFVGQRLRLTPPAEPEDASGWVLVPEVESGASGQSSPASGAGPASRSAPAGSDSSRTAPGQGGGSGSAAASGAGRVASGQSSAGSRPASASGAASGSRAASGGRPAPAGSSSSRAAPDREAWRWPAQGRVDAKSARVRTGDYGVRIMGQHGQNIHAMDSGKVMYAGDGLKAYGLLVIVQHSPEWISAYGHNDSILVKEGEEVRAGQPIATMGMGPGNAAMLHFEIRRDGKPVEPMTLLPPRN